MKEYSGPGTLSELSRLVKEDLKGKQDAFTPDDTLTLQDGTLSVALPNKALTSAEYEALSEEEKMADVQYIITDDNDESVGAILSQTIKILQTITEDAYNALTTKVSTTLYIIPED